MYEKVLESAAYSASSLPERLHNVLSGLPGTPVLRLYSHSMVPGGLPVMS